MWIIDFGIDMSLEDASKYEAPFKLVEERVKSQRDKSAKSWYGNKWWLHYAPRPGMRNAIEKMSRYMATPRVTKHRLFVYLDPHTLPDAQLIVFGRSDDYFLGILHSRLHELWARATGSQLREAGSGFRYTPTSTFETFPFPWAPGKEPKDDSRVKAIAQAAKELVEQRDRWLNPKVTVISEVTVTSGASEAEKKKRTLTNLYNARPTWLDLAHKKLDETVFAAYGWESDLSDEEILEKLLALNLERAKK